MQARLLINSDSPREAVRQVVDNPFSIGRDAANQLQLTDPAISDRHCLLHQKEDRCELIDLESHSGTFVNGIPIHRRFLEHGDTIRIGDSELTFLIYSNEDSAALHTSSGPEPSTSPTGHAPASDIGVDVGRMTRDLVA